MAQQRFLEAVKELNLCGALCTMDLVHGGTMVVETSPGTGRGKL